MSVRSSPEIIICGGRRLFREGVTGLLERTHHMRVVGDADDVQSAEKLIAPLAAQVLVASVNQLDAMTLTTIRQLTRAHPTVRVVLLTTRAISDTVRDAFAAGIS